MKIRGIKSPYRLKKLKESAYKYTIDELKNIIVNLSDLDIDIKSGRKQKGNNLEILFAKLCTNTY